MAELPHIKPSKPFQYHIRVDELNEQPPPKTPIHKKRRVICLGCCMAGVLSVAVVMIVLMLTIFHIERPIVTMNAITVTTRPSMINLTMEVAVKNRNVADFKYGEGTTRLYYYGEVIDEVHTPPGVAKARRTGRVDVAMGMDVWRMRGDMRLGEELRRGILNLESYTEVGGRVKIAGMIKKNFVVKMNCTIVASVFGQEVVEQRCMSKVSG